MVNGEFDSEAIARREALAKELGGTEADIVPKEEEPISLEETARKKERRKRTIQKVRRQLSLLSTKSSAFIGKQLKGKQPKPRTVNIPISQVLGTAKKPKGKVNPLQPNIESLIFPSGRAQSFSDKEKVKEGSILKAKNIFFK